MQHFVDGSLIKEATTKEHTIYFAPKSIYQLTYKGFVVLEEFIEQNDIQDDADHLVVARSSQPSPRPKLWRLERRPADDDLILTQAIVTKLFRQFAGRRPNYGQRELTGVLMVSFVRRNKVLDPHFRKKDSLPLGGKVSGVTSTHCMKAPILVQWLCDHTIISSPREAAEVAAHFVRFGLLVLVSDKDKVAKGDTVSTFVVHGPTQRGDPFVTVSHRSFHVLDIFDIHYARPQQNSYIHMELYMPLQMRAIAWLAGVRRRWMDGLLERIPTKD